MSSNWKHWEFWLACWVIEKYYGWVLNSCCETRHMPEENIRYSCSFPFEVIPGQGTAGIGAAWAKVASPRWPSRHEFSGKSYCLDLCSISPKLNSSCIVEHRPLLFSLSSELKSSCVMEHRCLLHSSLPQIKVYLHKIAPKRAFHAIAIKWIRESICIVWLGSLCNEKWCILWPLTIPGVILMPFYAWSWSKRKAHLTCKCFAFQRLQRIWVQMPHSWLKEDQGCANDMQIYLKFPVLDDIQSRLSPFSLLPFSR